MWTGQVPTVTETFMRQLHSLKTAINSTWKHYIRCFNPNSSKRELFFEEELLLHQMLYSGVLECIKVRKGGFYWRKPYAEFVDAFKYLTYPTPLALGRGEFMDYKAISKIIVQRAQLDPIKWRLGKTRIFLKDYEALLQVRSTYQKHCYQAAVAIQSAWRGYVNHSQYLALKRATLTIQGYLAAYRMRKAYIKVLNGVKASIKQWKVVSR